jgi:hypothetical protein
MAVLLIQATHQRDSLLPEDVAVNTWHVSTKDNVPANVVLDATEAINAIGDFYQAINGFISDLYTGVINFDAYNLADAIPRVPVVGLVDVGAAPASANFPGEVTLCLSFQAAAQSGVNQKRRRNRVHLPIGGGNVSVSNGERRPGTLALDTIEAAAQALWAASEASANWTWQVFSPTNAGPKNADGTYQNLINGISVVDNGWIDNSYDTIRARGAAPTARRTFGSGG